MCNSYYKGGIKVNTDTEYLFLFIYSRRYAPKAIYIIKNKPYYCKELKYKANSLGIDKVFEGICISSNKKSPSGSTRALKKSRRLFHLLCHSEQSEESESISGCIQILHFVLDDKWKGHRDFFSALRVNYGDLRQ